MFCIWCQFETRFDTFGGYPFGTRHVFRGFLLPPLRCKGCSRETPSYTLWHANDTQWHAPSDFKFVFDHPLQVSGKSSELATQEWIGGLLGPRWQLLDIYIFLGFYSSLDPTTNATRKAIRIPQLKLHRYKHKIGTNWARIPEFDPGCHHPGKHHWHQCRCHHVAGLVPSLLQS